jgi:glycosyltransferase involved in cell wall biosynthesis
MGKILLCDNGLPGLVRFRSDVIAHFLALGHAVTLVYPTCTDAAIWRNQLPVGAKCLPVKFNPSTTNPMKDMKYLWLLLKTYRRERPDLCIHYTIKPNIYGTWAARLLGCKNIAVVAGLGYIFTGNSLTKQIGRNLYRLGLRTANHVITLNETIRDKLVANKFVAPQQITLFRGGEGVNLSRYPLFRQRYDAPVRFLTVARVFYDKGYAEYVAAAEMVHRSYPDVEFEWLGDYEEHSPMTVPHEVLDRDVAAGKIRYLGTTDDVLQYLRRDGVCICLPSYHEGLSKSLMEACAVGLPIIASDIPGCRETVDEGVNGYLVPKCDAQALANAMMRFLQLTQSEKQQMAQASYAKATSTFDVKQTLKGYDTLVRELRA